MTVTVNPVATTVYTVTATSPFGCVNTANATVTIAAPAGNVCNVLYVTPSGSQSGVGSQTDPMDLETALEVGACNGTIVKMAIGDYITDTVISKVTSYITLEGGFDPSINWDKISTAGATRILRTATQSYSTVSSSIAMGTGIVNETGPDPEVIAINVANQTGFRFQDLTIETALNSPGTTMAGYEGPDVIGLRLNSCDNYNVVRTQAITSNAGDGADHIWSITATNGGDAIALDILSNGAGSNLIQSFLNAGAAGAWGVGPPNGTNGVSNNLSITGTGLVSNSNSFNLVGQPTIQMDDIACTETLMDFNQTVSGNWTFGAGSTPANATGSTVTTQYSTLGRKDINYGANPYAGFANILLDAQVIPIITTTAPIIQGVYRICAGQSVDFSASNGGVGYIYHWDMGGGSIPNNYDGIGFGNLQGIQFDTPGIYTITLQFETNCCGLSIPATLDIHVEETPTITIAPYDSTLCFGSNVPITISVDDNINFGQILWSPSTGLDSANTFTVNALPGDTQTYSVLVTDSTGLCPALEYVTINNVNLEVTTSTTSTTCGPDGTATANVTGGSGNYAYQWDDPASQTTATASNLAVGIYHVMVTDLDLGCIDSATTVVNPGPGSLVGFVSNINAVSCSGNSDGDATVSITGGQAPFSYVWSPVGGSTIGTNATSNTTTLLPTGTYDVLITDDIGCTYTVNAYINEPDTLLVVQDSLYNPSCLGAMDGYLSIDVDRGVGPYTIVWDDPNSQQGYVLDSVGVGTYCAFVSDANGCTDSMCFTLTAQVLNDTIYDTICQFEVYTLPNGQVVNISSDTIAIDTLINSIGCDSVVTSIVTIIPTKSSIIDTTICMGQSIVVNGNVYDTTVIGAIDTAINVGPFNCDSFVTINLMVQELVVEIIDTTICQGQSLTIAGQNYTQSGLYYDTLFYNTTNCDSIQFVINLQIDSFMPLQIDSTICQGESIIINGQSYSSSGSYIDTAYYGISGCDSVHYLINLQVDTVIVQNIDTTVCEGQSITVNGLNYNSTGIFTDTISYSTGNCDSLIYVIDLQIDSVINSNIDTTICQGDSLVINGVSYTIAGSYSDTSYYVPSGCIQDIFTINLSVAPNPSVIANSSSVNDSSCVNNNISLFGSGTVGVNYTWNNGVNNNIGFNTPLGQTSYIVTGVDAVGCSSQDTIAITGLPVYSNTVNITICEDENYILPDGTTVNGAGSYPVVLNSSLNCDSIITTIINVNLLGNFQNLEDISVCDGLAQTISLSANNMISFEWFVNNGGGNQSLLGNSDYLGANTNELSFNLDTSLHMNTYSVQMVDECGNTYNESFELEVYSPHPVINPIEDTTFCLHEVDIVTVDYDGYNYEWNNGEFGQSILPNESGQYIVNFLENITNCLMSDTIEITLEDCIANCVVLAPTGFSPDNSGNNDIFQVVTSCEDGFSSFQFYVYNRWGELVFSTDDWREGWDGTYKGRIAEIGTYTYYVEYVKEFSQEKEMLKGNVTLIR